MIHGIGVDIIEIERIGKSIEQYGDAFLSKLFTQNEIAYCKGKKNPAQHFAARFAAKEAFSKAIATGWSGQFDWKHVEVMNEESGKPIIQLSGALAEVWNDYTIFLSLSHSDTSVVAFVVLEKR